MTANNVTTIERLNPASGARPTAIVPQNMNEAYRLGQAIVASGMAPRGMETAEKCMIAIMRGLEVGLTPMQAVDNIAIVGGRPTLWGDAVIGLVRASGLCSYVRETIEGEGDEYAARCETLRRGESEPVVGMFSVADAKRAGLWGKSGPWQQYPDRMLKMRARAFALRDAYADVLGGLYLKEEIEEEVRRARPAQPRRGPPEPLTARAPITVGDVVVNTDPAHDPETGEIASEPVDDEPQVSPAALKLFDAARNKARRGWVAFGEWEAKLKPTQREALDAIRDELTDLADEADTVVENLTDESAED
jgi:hypothetical protein